MTALKPSRLSCHEMDKLQNYHPGSKMISSGVGLVSICSVVLAYNIYNFCIVKVCTNTIHAVFNRYHLLKLSPWSRGLDYKDVNIKKCDCKSYLQVLSHF